MNISQNDKTFEKMCLFVRRILCGSNCEEIASETNMKQRTRCTGNASLFVAFAIISAKFLPVENRAKLAVDILN